jgi:hypothetical protein
MPAVSEYLGYNHQTSADFTCCCMWFANEKEKQMVFLKNRFSIISVPGQPINPISNENF